MTIGVKMVWMKERRLNAPSTTINTPASNIPVAIPPPMEDKLMPREEADMHKVSVNPHSTPECPSRSGNRWPNKP